VTAAYLLKGSGCMHSTGIACVAVSASWSQDSLRILPPSKFPRASEVLLKRDLYTIATTSSIFAIFSRVRSAHNASSTVYICSICASKNQREGGIIEMTYRPRHRETSLGFTNLRIVGTLTESCRNCRQNFKNVTCIVVQLY
jgi:hypothetical protein